MTEVSVHEAKAALSEYLNRVAFGRERIVILSRGRPKAALISVEDLHRFEEWEEEQEAAALAAAIAEETRFYSVPEVEAELTASEADEQDG